MRHWVVMIWVKWWIRGRRAAIPISAWCRRLRLYNSVEWDPPFGGFFYVFKCRFTKNCRGGFYQQYLPKINHLVSPPWRCMVRQTLVMGRWLRVSPPWRPTNLGLTHGGWWNRVFYEKTHWNPHTGVKNQVSRSRSAIANWVYCSAIGNPSTQTFVPF